jgi:hypothetical protein
MAINRAIDYTKASKNIALAPKMETFDAFDALEFQIRCINSLRASPSSPGAQLEIVPTATAFGTERRLCRFILTDRLWLTENLLCLLSNAVKYSDDDTTVKVTVQLIPANTQLSPSTEISGLVYGFLHKSDHKKALAPISEDSKSNGVSNSSSSSHHSILSNQIPPVLPVSHLTCP